jgi:hypothetical protein
MYWFKRFFLFSFGLLLIIQSCKNDSRAGNDTGRYFDLKKYFASEAARLKKSHPLVTKTASHNSEKETKKVNVQDWSGELGLFSESDINKPAWKASYAVSDADGITTYNAIDPNLKTRYIIVKKQHGKIKLILIFNHAKTTLFGKVLYETTERLSYVPDSLYQIEKRQYVRTLGLNNYYIKGLFDQ